MKKNLIALVAVLWGACFCGADQSVNIDSISLLGIDLVHQEKIDSALAGFKKITAAYPDQPAGYFFTAATYQTVIDDYRADSYQEQFNHFIELAIEKGKAKLKQKNSTATDYFYTGAALGYRGIFRAFHGNWWGAFWDGGKAKRMMEKALKLDTTFYDTYFGLGAYYYWRSAKSKILWWLPFFGDNRQKGIDYTKLAIAKGKFSKVEGKYALLRIYAEENDWHQVLAWYDSVKSVNPDDPFSLWLVGQAYINLKEYDSARKTFSRLLQVLKLSRYFDIASEMEVRYNFALIDFYQQKYINALSQIGFVFAHKETAKENHYAKNTLKMAQELKKEIDKKLGIK